MEKEHVLQLLQRRVDLLRWLNPPPPDPSVWPPVGWEVNPNNPQQLYRVMDAEALREELFGSERKKVWLRNARLELANIERGLIKYFFPEPKEEGSQRTTKHGWLTTLKTSLDRKVDQTAVADVLDTCKTKANAAIVWEAKLALAQYRKLPAEVKAVFDEALTITPGKPVFDAVFAPKATAKKKAAAKKKRKARK